MKKLILFIVMLVLASSCKKKEYNCMCSTTILYTPAYGGGQNYFVSNNKPMDKKMNEKQAQSVCDHEAANINQSYINYWTENGSRPATGATFTTRCSLQ